MTNVLILGATAEAPPPGLPEAESGASYLFLDADPVRLSRVLPDVDVILAWDDRSADLRSAWSGAARLRWIQGAGVGVEWLLFPELVASDVVLTNCRGIFDASMPEYVLGLMMALAKDIAGTLAAQRERIWDRRPLDPLAGRRALIVGAGTIGRATAGLLRSIGMQVTLVATRERAGTPDEGVIRGVGDLRSLLPSADWLVLVTPLTERTRGLIGAAELASLPRGARLVNVGRGPVVVEEALVEALRDERLAGAALDVFDREPLPPEHPLWGLPNIIISPHIGGDVPGYLGWITDAFLANLRRYLAGEPLRNIVDKRLGYVPTQEDQA